MARTFTTTTLMDNNRVAIIAEGGEWTVLPVIRELKDQFKIVGFFQNKKNPVNNSRGLSFSTNILNTCDSLFHKNLLYKLYKSKVKTIICLNEEIKLSLVKCKHLYKNFSFAFPSYRSYETAIQKNKSIRFAKKVGIPVPEIYDYEDFSVKEKLKISFPEKIVVKADRGVSSLNVRYATNFEDLNEIYDDFKTSDDGDKPCPIVQEFVGGPTYLTQALCQDGKVKALVSHVKHREWPSSGGVTCLARTIFSKKLESYSKRLLENLNWHGEAGIEWKYDTKRNDFYFIEMNPRFEGSLDLTISSGINFPNLLVDIINEKKLKYNYDYQDNIYYRWFYRLDFEHFLYEPYGFFKFFFESFNPKINGEIKVKCLSHILCVWKYPIYTLIRRLRHRYSV